MMTSVFDENGRNVPVTVLSVEDVVVSFKGDNGYELGIGKKSKANAALTGKYAKVGYVPQYRVFFADDETELNVGDEVGPQVLEKGADVNVTGVSKGKGFSGVVKRWGFAGGPASHGQTDRLRAPGSIGAGTSPGRVLKGKKMAGRQGGERVTVKNLKVVDVGEDYILVSGAVPGPNGSYIVIAKQ